MIVAATVGLSMRCPPRECIAVLLVPCPSAFQYCHAATDKYGDEVRGLLGSVGGREAERGD